MQKSTKNQQPSVIKRDSRRIKMRESTARAFLLRFGDYSAAENKGRDLTKVFRECAVKISGAYHQNSH